MTTLTGFNTTRMDATMVNMQDCLNKISLRIHTDIIPAAEENAYLAEELVGSATLDRPEMTRAMEEAQAVRFSYAESTVLIPGVGSPESS